MRIDPGSFLRQAVELGCLDARRAAEVGALVRRGGAPSIDRLVVDLGLLEPEQVSRVLLAIRPPLEPEAHRTAYEASSLTTESGHWSDLPMVSESPLEFAGARAGTAPGESSPKYVTMGLLGKGGMGEVLLVADRAIGREVALKRIHEPEDEDQVRRFVVEGQVTGQLEHPNIVPVYELGFERETGRPFMVMKRLRGRSLAEILEESRHRAGISGESADPSVEIHRQLEAFLKIADAVAYAHSRGVIHRDLKPANVVIGEYGEVHVVDWGLAKILDSPEIDVKPDRLRSTAAGDAQRTREGQVSGTPMYMPPEQARGEISSLDERSDVYGLGAILYEMLALRSPFEASNDLLRLLSQVEKGRWMPLSERSVAPWEIPRELDAVVGKAMARRQEDRYDSVRALREDVEDYLAGRALSAFEYSPWQLLAKWARRHRTAVLGATATAVAALLGLVATVIGVSAARSAEAERIHLDRARAASERFVDANESWPSAPQSFDPASAQQYFLDRLPLLVDMAKAFQDHPAPPEDWAARIASLADELQRRAEEIADWALAEHLGQSLDAWGVVTKKESDLRVERSRSRRRDRIGADIARLEDLLRRIGEAEEKRKGALQPGELRERGRLVGGLESRRELQLRLVQELSRDNDRLRRKHHLILGRDFQEPALTRAQRLFCVHALSVLGDAQTRGPAGTAAELVARTLETAWEMRLPPDEIAAWILATGRLEAVDRDAFPGSSARAIIGRAVEEYRPRDLDATAVSPVTIAGRRALAFLDVVEGGSMANLHADPPVAEELLADLAEWASASAAPEIEYTARLLGLATSDRTERQLEFVLDQIGIRGDQRAPRTDRPEVAAVPVLRSILASAPEPLLTNRALAGPRAEEARRIQRVAAAAAGSLSRLGASECAGVLLEKWQASGPGSLFARRIALALALLPVDPGVASESVEAALQRGTIFLLRRDLDEALREFDLAVRLDPRRADVYFHRSESRYGKGDREGAIADLDRAIDLSPEDPRNFMRRGVFWSEMGRHGRALEDLDRAMALSPRDPVPVHERATVFWRMGDIRAAAAEYGLALELDPRLSASLHGRGQALLALGDLEAALAEADRFVALEPMSWHPLRLRGKIRQAMGRHQEAVEDFTRAIAIAHDDPYLLCDRAESRDALQDRGGAYDDLFHSIELEPNVDAYRLRGLLLLKDGKLEQAISDLDRGIALDPRDARSYSLRAIAHGERKHYDQALRDYGQSIEIDRTAFEPYLNRGVLRMNILQDPAGALSDLDRAVQLEDRYETRLERARALIQVERHREGAAEARRAASHAPSEWNPWLLLGIALGRSGEAAEAELAFQEALRRAPVPAQPTIEDVRRRTLGR